MVLLGFAREKPTPVRSGRAGDVENLPFSFFLLTVNCQLSTVNCQLPTVNCLLLFEGMSFVESFKALPVAHKPPVPRLVTDALAIVFGKGHFKAESGCVGF